MNKGLIQNEGGKRIIRNENYAKNNIGPPNWKHNIKTSKELTREKKINISGKVIPKIKVMRSAFNQDRNKRRRHTFKNLKHKLSNKYT